MILKTMRNKNPRFREKIEYLISDKGRFNAEKGFLLFHNLSSTDVDGMVEDFQENDKFRIKRKNGTVFLHEVMSFDKKDKPFITKKIMWDLSNEYIRKRGGDDCICLASVHWENENPHIHFLFHYTKFRSHKTLNLNNKEFKEIRVEMERYQMKKYSKELSNSVVYLKSKNIEKSQDILKKTEKEVQYSKRTGKKSNMEIISNLLVQLHGESGSTEEFLNKIVDKGIGVYKYKGTPMGVLFQKKRIRFSRLNISQEQIRALNVSYSRIKQLEAIRKKKEKQRERSKGRSR